MSLLSRLAVQAARAYGILSSRSNNISADYLVVAGGGGGSVGNGGGGGGAGGLLTSTATLSTLNTYSITVGAGGISGYNGSNSVLSGTGLTTITSIGGGGGGSGVSGGNGGSGGGAGNGYSGGTGTSGQGNNGGTGNLSPYNIGGGGGGASVAGGNASASVSGTGGNGTASSISGSSVTYAGGGSGGSDGRSSATIGAAGTGGGGAGSISGVGTAGTANTGGGGGGGGRNGSLSPAEQNGGQGGSGIVIISYTSATPKFLGGTITTSGGKQIHTFTSSGTLSPITPITASYLVVAGGGGTSLDRSGGGGGGGLLTGSTTIYSGATYVVTVGAGGAGGSGAANATSAQDGSNSVLSGTGLTTITSIGGGGGNGAGGAGRNGGSGGGGGGNGSTSTSGGTGTSGQGTNGGNGVSQSGAGAGGGGGGATSAGSNAASGTVGGAGGAGTASSISGTSVTYAGGGGGGASTTGGTGGAGGGGDGAGGSPATQLRGVSGTQNLGGGGGGGSNFSTTAVTQASGGSGIVIISYAGSQQFNGGLVTSSGGNTIHTFTSTGALTPLTNNLNNSLRFRSSASAYLNRTPTLAGSTTIGTFSNWLKLGAISTDKMMYHVAGTSGNNNRFYISFNADNTFQIVGYNSSASIVLNLNTTQVLRDPSAWYHIVVAIDTTQATSSNRAKLYINGNQVTAFSTATYPSQNQALGFTNNTSTLIGANQGPSNYYDGYMTDINFIDGQALEPYYFGNNDANGVWKPIQYKGTYGTNGFYLTFGNTTSTTTLGYDSSPNGNNWTCNNISLTAGTTYDAMTDVPTNTSATVANYAIANPLDKSTNVTVTNGNFTVSTAVTNAGIRGSMYVSSGKYYWEATCTTKTSYPNLGIADAAWGLINVGSSSGSYGYATDGLKYNNGSTASYGATYTSGDVIGVALDLDAGTLVFYKNNTSQGTAYSSLSGTFAPAFAGQGSDVWNVNFGQQGFKYTPPTGFVALNTYNLPTPTILQGNKYMDATLYTGNGSSQTIVNAGQFKPDFVWVKTRNVATTDHCLFDAVRGVSKYINSNNTGAEATYTGFGTTAFNSNGFTVADNAGGGYLVNGSTGSPTYVGWQWQAGQGTTSSNTSGSITSTVSVNTTAGFSIVTYTGNGTTGATIGHGLGVVPKMIIFKDRDSVTNWPVYHVSLGNATAVNVNQTNASFASSSFNSTTPTSTLITLGGNGLDVNNTSKKMLAYCWAAIAGYSAFGSWTGNGSSDGPMIYLGFQPKFIMWKRTDSSTGGEWVIQDTTRKTYNPIDTSLYPNLSNAEGTNETFRVQDTLSNGFKIRASAAQCNASGGTYIYAAFASNPFRNSNAF